MENLKSYKKTVHSSQVQVQLQVQVHYCYSFMRWSDYTELENDPNTSVFDKIKVQNRRMYDIDDKEFPDLMRLSDEKNVDYEYKMFDYLYRPDINGFKEVLIGVETGNNKEGFDPPLRKGFIVEATTEQGTEFVINITNECIQEEGSRDVEIYRNDECVGIVDDYHPSAFIDIMIINIDGVDAIRGKWINVSECEMRLDEGIVFSVDSSFLESNATKFKKIVEIINMEYEMVRDDKKENHTEVSFDDIESDENNELIDQEIKNSYTRDIVIALWNVLNEVQEQEREHERKVI